MVAGPLDKPDGPDAMDEARELPLATLRGAGAGYAFL